MKLAINGGRKIRSIPFPTQDLIGKDEINAVVKVMERGTLTGYAANVNNFHGGPEIRALVDEWKSYFGVKYAIPCNSATSGLIIACMATPTANDTIYYVSPYSMTCSATAPIMANKYFSVRFCDIDDTYNIDIGDLHKKKTNNILAVSLFGNPFQVPQDSKRDAFIIEDAAQALGATINGKYAGTLYDIGVYSFNQGKAITSGEGGMIVTNNAELAEKCMLYMNHAEAVINDIDVKSTIESKKDKLKPYQFDIVGGNYRMTEIQAAMLRVQLKKLKSYIAARQHNCNMIIDGIKDIPFLKGPIIPDNVNHSFYVLALTYDKAKANGIKRETFVDAMKAELPGVAGREGVMKIGAPIHAGYVKPIYKIPYFFNRYRPYLNNTFKQTFPNFERIENEELVIIYRLIGPGANDQSIRDVIRAFHKVADNMGELENG